MLRSAQKKADSQLVFKEASPTNVTTFRIHSSGKSVDFKMTFLGETVAFVPLAAADENISAAIIQSCHHMMKSKWESEKYNFAVLCSEDPDPKTSSRLHKKHHFLPDDELCQTCVEQGRLNEMLTIWNKTLSKVSSMNCDCI